MDKRGAEEKSDYAILTNDIMEATFGKNVTEYKRHKQLGRRNLRDHMDDVELVFTMLGEVTTTRLTKERDSQGVPLLRSDAQDGGRISGSARKDFENTLGKSVVSKENYLNKPESQKRLKRKQKED